MNGFRQPPKIKDSRKEWKRRVVEIDDICQELAEKHNKLEAKLREIEELTKNPILGHISVKKVLAILQQ